VVFLILEVVCFTTEKCYSQYARLLLFIVVYCCYE